MDPSIPNAIAELYRAYAFLSLSIGETQLAATLAPSYVAQCDTVVSDCESSKVDVLAVVEEIE